MVEVMVLIPARGGSKGILRKNIKPLGNHPLIAYSIAAGLQSTAVSRTVVSTDDQQIAQIARSYGAEVPFIRPPEYAQDDTPDLPVFVHALKWLNEQEGYQPDLVVQLRPTTPFRPPGMVDDAVRIMQENPQATSVRGVVPSQQNPYKMWKKKPDGSLRPLLVTEFSEPYNMPRQELPETFWQTGHIDVIRTGTILEGSMSGARIYGHFIDPQFSVDLDNLQDWLRAEYQLQSIRSDIVVPDQSGRLAVDQLKLVVLDFDGVLTDNRVYVSQQGEESVAAHRGDGMGIDLLKKAGIDVVILSTEKNPVVSARAEKLQVPVFQGIDQKGKALEKLLNERNLTPAEVFYVGNDVNDLPCFPLAQISFAVADAHSDVIEQADYVLNNSGGKGAVRELCDLILSNIGR